VCRAALQAGVGRVVHVSSWTVYGMDLGQPAREEFLLRPMSEPYTLTKAAGDLAVQRMIVDDRLPAVIVRPGTIFGPGDRLNFGRIADRLRAGKGVIVGSGNNALPFVYVTDIVKGLLLGLDREQAVGQAYNIGNDLPLTQRQVLDAIAEEIGAPRARLRVPLPRALQSELHRRASGVARARREPGHYAPWRQAVRRGQPASDRQGAVRTWIQPCGFIARGDPARRCVVSITARG